MHHTHRPGGPDKNRSLFVDTIIFEVVSSVRRTTRAGKPRPSHTARPTRAHDRTFRRRSVTLRGTSTSVLVLFVASTRIEVTAHTTSQSQTAAFYASRWSPYLPAQARHGKCKHTDKCTNKSYRTTATAVQQLYNPVAGRARSRRRSVDDTHYSRCVLYPPLSMPPRPTSNPIHSSSPR